MIENKPPLPEATMHSISRFDATIEYKPPLLEATMHSIVGHRHRVHHVGHRHLL